MEKKPKEKKETLWKLKDQVSEQKKIIEDLQSTVYVLRYNLNQEIDAKFYVIRNLKILIKEIERAESK